MGPEDRPQEDVFARLLFAERRTIEAALEQGGVPTADVADLVQEVAIVALLAAREERVTWTDRQTFPAWLATVAFRCALVYQGRAARREIPAADPVDVGTAPSAEDRLVAAETLRLLREGTTAGRWRVVIGLATGIPTAALAEREGLTARGIYSRLHEARADFRAALARDAATVPIRRNPRSKP